MQKTGCIKPPTFGYGGSRYGFFLDVVEVGLQKRKKPQVPPVVDGPSSSAFQRLFVNKSRPDNRDKVGELNLLSTEKYHEFSESHSARCDCAKFNCTLATAG